MAGRSKFVSIALAITLLVLPVAALSACWIPMPAMQEMAMGDAGMTTTSMPPVNIQQVPISGSCCELSAADAPPVSVPRAPARGATNMATTAGTSVLEVPPTAIKAEPSKAQPCGSGSSGSSLQATLCVFLI
jgi:hypothetical protein